MEQTKDRATFASMVKLHGGSRVDESALNTIASMIEIMSDQGLLLLQGLVATQLLARNRKQ